MGTTGRERFLDKISCGLKDGTIKVSVVVHPPDRSDGFHSPFARQRPKITQIPLGPGKSVDSFFRDTDEISLPDDLAFYRGATIAAYSHIDHLIDDLCYRLAKTNSYKGRGRMFSTVSEKLAYVQALSKEEGPLLKFKRRISSIIALIRRFDNFRNIMSHGEFSLHVSKEKKRIILVKKFGQPKRQNFKMQSAFMPIEHIASRASRLDQLARHVDRLHFELCEAMSLPSGLMEVEA